MYLNLRSLILAFCVLSASCSAPKARRALSLTEQIAVDTEQAQSLAEDFSKRVKFVSLPRAENFLTKTAVRLAQASHDFQLERIHVRIHEDADLRLSRAFSFPGTLISLPMSFLKKVDYENELAALIAFELGNVMNRHLANQVEAYSRSKTKTAIVLFGEGSVFNLDREERVQSIKVGMQMLYFAGYDTRGMVSIFQRYANYYGNPVSESYKKEVEFNVREAQRLKSDLLPSLKPIVRTAEFIQFKKELGRVR